MAELVMVLGESGSGKSTSLRGFDPDEVGILNVAGKRLPFKNSFGDHVINNADYGKIVQAVTKGKLKKYVVDDSQYLMAFESFARAKEIGYGKFTDMALNFYNMLKACQSAPDDVIVYFLHHVDKDENGLIKPKTQGRMLDEKLNIAGLFTIILLAKTDGKEHWFETQNAGDSVAKTPMGMFEDVKIPNDLKMVDNTIRAYYDMEV